MCLGACTPQMVLINPRQSSVMFALQEVILLHETVADARTAPEPKVSNTISASPISTSASIPQQLTSSSVLLAPGAALIPPPPAMIDGDFCFDFANSLDLQDSKGTLSPFADVCIPHSSLCLACIQGHSVARHSTRNMGSCRSW